MKTARKSASGATAGPMPRPESDRGRPRRSSHLTSLILSGVIAALFVSGVLTEARIPVLTELELSSRDLRFRIRGPLPAGGEVAVVVIDDPSIKAIGRWPWSRKVLARLLLSIHDAGAASVGLDFILSEPEANPEPAAIRNLMDAYEVLGLHTAAVENRAFYEEMAEAVEATDNDRLAAAVLSLAGDVVLAAALGDGGPTPATASGDLARFAYSPMVEVPAYRTFTGLTGPIDAFSAEAASVGFVNVLPDPDGAVRRGALAMGVGDRLFGPLALRTVQVARGLSDDDLRFAGDRFRVGNLEIPTDSNGGFFINYYGAHGAVPTWSAVDLLTGVLPEGALRGKIVFVGGGAMGLGDHWPNPFTGFYWGVETHATVADNLITGRFLRRPDWLRYAEAAFILLAGLAFWMILSRLPLAAGVPLAAGLVAGGLAGSQYLFSAHQLVTLQVLPLGAAVGVSSAVVLVRYFIEGREKRLIKGAFQQYLSTAVVERILRHPEQLALGGEKRDLSVLFSDIRGFTRISEALDPEVLVGFMNRYLTAMTDVVLTEEGTLDKYIGDAIMAFFGAPADQDDHPVRACRTAIRMVEALYGNREKWVRRGLPLVQVGIGINSGPVVVGNMGSDRRFDYTVMGDNVNLASRLEGLTKRYGVKIIASETTRERVGDRFAFRELDVVRVKGRGRPVRIFELLGDTAVTGISHDFIAHFEAGLAAYRSRDWEGAIRRFETVRRIKPEDRPALGFIERCREYLGTPPPPDWDGVWEVREK